jgi:alpha-tubulin suppressor-like RCC1 family protein
LRRDKIRLMSGRWLAILTVSVVVAGLGQATIPSAHASPTGSNVYSWGLNVSGELGNGTTVNSDVPVQVTLPGVVTPVAVAMGGDSDDLPNPDNASLAIGSDGNLYSWGDNSDGELGIGELPTYNSTGYQCTANCNSTTPVKVDFPSGLSPISISVGAQHDLALASNGSIYEWGNYEGGNGNGGLQPTPTVFTLPGGGTAAAIAAGFEDDVALGSNGAVYDWGDNTFGELGDGSTNPGETGPVQVALPSGVTATSVATGQTSSEDETSLAIGSDGHIYEWGYGVGNAPGPSDVPVAVSLPGGVTPTAIATDDGTNLAIGSDGNAYEWSVDSRSPQEVVLPPGITASSVSAGFGTDIVVGGNGQLYAWGSDNDGQYGNGSTGNGQTTPVDVSTAGEPAFSSVVQGVYAVVALGSGGAVSAPVFGSATPALDTIAGMAYSSVFYATGDPTYGLANAPSWLSITANGAVTGTPPAGTTTFSYGVTAVNGGGSASLGPFTVSVQPSTTISGQVTGTAAAGVAGAVVQSCTAVTGDECQSTTTSSSGTFTLDAAVSSSVVITAFPPQGSGLVQTSTDPIAVPSSGVANETISLDGIAPLPPGLSVNNTTAPTVYWASPANVALTGCTNGLAAVSVVGQDTDTGEYSAQVIPVAETPAGSGSYAGVIPPQEPVHGPVQIDSAVTCPQQSPLLPSGGPSTGGTPVLVSGSGFTGATGVSFGGTPAASYSVISDQMIEAVAPPGTGAISVAVSVGGSSTVIAQYTYSAIQSVSPATGPADGGTPVTITGTGLGSATAVLFGSTGAAFTQVSDTEIVAYSPPGSGTQDITVQTTYDGTTPVTASDEFTYETSDSASAAATVVRPAEHPVVPGVRLTAVDTPARTALPPATARLLDSGSGAPSLQQIVDFINQYVPKVPGVSDEMKALVADAEAVVHSGCASSEAASVATIMALIAPEIAALSATIQLAVEIGLEAAFPAIGPLLVNPLVQFVLSAAVKSVVTWLATQAATAAVTVIIGPICHYFNPDALVDPSGTVLDTNGNPVSGATATIVRADTAAGPFTPVAATSPGIAPAVNPETTAGDGVFHWDVDAGWYEVQASAPGCSAPGNLSQPLVTAGPYPVPPPQVGLTLTLACPDEAPPPVPAVSSLSQASGPAAGGTTVTVVGVGFTPSSTVAFGTAAVHSVTYLSPQALAVTSPPGSGLVDITVANAGATSATSSADQFYYGSPPAVTGLSAASGPQAGGAVITITGSGFTGATAVGFGGVPATFTVESDTQIQATVPAGVPGTIDVLVSTPAGTSAQVPADQYTYTHTAAAPVITSAAAATFTAGQAGTFTVTTTGTPAPAITESGALPPGIKLTDNGNGTATLAGTAVPGSGGTYSLALSAANGTAPAATQAFKLTVDQPPAFTADSPPLTASAGQAYGYTFTASGYPAPAYALGSGAPSWLAINASTGKLTGSVPAGTSSFSYSVTATSAAGSAATGTITVKISQMASLSFTGSISYMNSGPITSGSLKVARTPRGLVSGVSGTITIPGTSGGSAKITVSIVWVLGIAIGDIVVTDPGAHLQATAIILSRDVIVSSSGQVTGTAAGLQNRRPYTLRFSI